MGLGAGADLIWGIPILAYDEETGEPTPFWDEENDDWISLPGELEIRTYGHYDDPDNQRAILTSSRVEHYSGDCWEPTQINPIDLDTEMNNDKAYSKSSDQLREANIEGYDTFYGRARWWLVADFG